MTAFTATCLLKQTSKVEGKEVKINGKPEAPRNVYGI